MTTLNDFNFTDDVDDVRAAHVNALQAAALRSEYSNEESLSATRVLLDVDTPIQRFDCNGADRIVKAPAADAESNHPYLIFNATTVGSYTLTLKSNDEATTHAVLAAGEFVFLLPNGVGGYVLAGGSPTVLVSSDADNALTEGTDGKLYVADGGGGGGDGWISVSGAWTYASANTITVPTDATTVYKKGMGIRWKQGGGYKYAYITGVNTTLLTVTGGTDYTVANSAITDVAYTATPQTALGFPVNFACAAPTWDTATIDNGTGGQQPTAGSQYFSIIGNFVHLKIVLGGSGAVKNGTGLFMDFTIPATLPSISEASIQVIGNAYTSANSVGLSGAAVVTSATTITLRFTSMTDNWTVPYTGCAVDYRY